MSVHTRGKLTKTKLTEHDELGRYTHVYFAEENKLVFHTCQEYYWYMMKEYKKHAVPYAHFHNTPEPQEGSSIPVIFDYHDRRNLEAMCPGASFSVCDDTIHVDNWAVNEDVLLHKHPEFGEVEDYMSTQVHELEWSVHDGKCDLCHTQIPGTLLFVHQMYQL